MAELGYKARGYSRAQALYFGLPKAKAPGNCRRLCHLFGLYLLAVLSRHVLLDAAQPVVVGATVMSPRAVIV